MQLSVKFDRSVEAAGGGKRSSTGPAGPDGGARSGGGGTGSGDGCQGNERGCLETRHTGLEIGT